MDTQKAKKNCSYLNSGVAAVDGCQTQQEETPAVKRQSHFSKSCNNDNLKKGKRGGGAQKKILGYSIDFSFMALHNNPHLLKSDVLSARARRAEDVHQVSETEMRCSLCAAGKFNL